VVSVLAPTSSVYLLPYFPANFEYCIFPEHALTASLSVRSLGAPWVPPLGSFWLWFPLGSLLGSACGSCFVVLCSGAFCSVFLAASVGASWALVVWRFGVPGPLVLRSFCVLAARLFASYGAVGFTCVTVISAICAMMIQ